MTRIAIIALTWALTTMTSAGLAAQSPTPAPVSATVTGQVVDAGTKAPVRQAIGSWRHHAMEEAAKVRLADPFTQLPARRPKTQLEVHAEFGDENVMARWTRVTAPANRCAENTKTPSRDPVGVRS